MYKVTINGETKGVYKENNIQEITEKFIEALNKESGKPDIVAGERKLVLKIYVEKVEPNEN